MNTKNVYAIISRIFEKVDIMDKKTIGILFGGVSSEHDISTISAKGIISNIDKEKYNLILLGITKNGEWYLFDDDVNMLMIKNYLCLSTVPVKNCNKISIVT